MFTGIIEGVGHVQNIDGNRFTLQHSFREPFDLGESIAISGACMTVLASTTNTITVEVMEESRNKTCFHQSAVGQIFNLERSVMVGQRNSGHLVTGHIDELGTIRLLQKKDDFWLVRIQFSKHSAHLVVSKGSIAVDGTSLTVSNLSALEAQEPWFEVCVLPFTWNETTFHTKKVDDFVHLEFDLFGKYVARLNQKM
jgi:riboflavin synthase